MSTIITTILTFLSGVTIGELIKYILPYLRQFFKSRKDANKVFYENLDPILKATSELFGKLESLSKEDFSTFINLKNSNSINPIHNQKYVLYLFAQFWAQIEYLRLESQYVNLSQIKKGRELLRFVETIESRKYRVIDRSMQRIIGECLLSNKEQKFRIMTLKDFMEALNNEENTLSIWIKSLEEMLLSVKDKKKRQIILRFGVILAALIDHFDPKNKIVRRRQIYLNKLNPKSKEMINSSLFGHYLIFVKNKTQYFQ